MKTTPILCALLASAGLATSWALAQSTQTPSTTTTKPAETARDRVPAADSDFLKQAAQDGNAEIEASKLAQSKATNPDVKSFASQMVDDHTAAAEELKKIADAKGVKVPTEPSLMQKAKLKLLAAADGEKFDQRYTEDFGVKAHQDTVKLFQKEIANGKDPDVKAFAQKTLPKLQHHLSLASTMEASVVPTAAGNKSDMSRKAPGEKTTPAEKTTQ